MITPFLPHLKISTCWSYLPKKDLCPVSHTVSSSNGEFRLPLHHVCVIAWLSLFRFSHAHSLSGTLFCQAFKDFFLCKSITHCQLNSQCRCLHVSTLDVKCALPATRSLWPLTEPVWPTPKPAPCSGSGFKSPPPAVHVGGTLRFRSPAGRQPSTIAVRPAARDWGGRGSGERMNWRLPLGRAAEEGSPRPPAPPLSSAPVQRFSPGTR